MRLDLRLSVAIVVAGAVGGGALILLAGAYQGEFRAWLEEDLRTRGKIVIAALSVATAGPLLGFSAYLWFVSRGRVLRVCAALLVVAALLLVFFLFRLASLL